MGPEGTVAITRVGRTTKKPARFQEAAPKNAAPRKPLGVQKPASTAIATRKAAQRPRSGVSKAKAATTKPGKRRVAAKTSTAAASKRATTPVQEVATAPIPEPHKSQDEIQAAAYDEASQKARAARQQVVYREYKRELDRSEGYQAVQLEHTSTTLLAYGHVRDVAECYAVHACATVERERGLALDGILHAQIWLDNACESRTIVAELLAARRGELHTMQHSHEGYVDAEQRQLRALGSLIAELEAKLEGDDGECREAEARLQEACAVVAAADARMQELLERVPLWLRQAGVAEELLGEWWDQ